MKSLTFVFAVTLASVATVGPVMADTPAQSGTFEQAGRLVDLLTSRLGSAGAGLAQQLQGRGTPLSAEEAGRLVDLLTSRLGSAGVELAQQLQGRGTPRSAEEAGRLVDQLAGRLGSIGAELTQQIQGRGVPGHRGGRMGPMMDPAERPLITIMLHHRSELGLTPEQVSRLETLRGEYSREAIRRDADIRIAELDLAGLLGQEPIDFGKVETKVREVSQLRADLRIARLRAVEQGKAVLTPDQRTRLQTMLNEMHHGPGGSPGPRHSADSGARL